MIVHQIMILTFLTANVLFTSAESYFGFAMLMLLLIIVPYIVNFIFLSAILLFTSAEINSSVSVDWDHAKGQPKNKRFVYVYALFRVPEFGIFC